MRKPVLILALILLLGMVLPAGAELYLDQEPPAEWADRDDLLRLTTFPTLINDCTLLEVGGKSMLIDGGVKKWRNYLWDALGELGYQHVDVIFNTHPHDDHLECVYWLLKKGFTADEFWSQYSREYPNELLQQTIVQLDRAGIPYHQLSQYETVDFGGATLVFYWLENGSDLNSRSAQMHITFGDTSILMAADAEGGAQEKLLKVIPPELFRADLLKYPHHGIVQTRADYMDAVSPIFAFVTNRKWNVVNTMHQLEFRGIPARYTTAGRLVMVTDGKDWYIMQYRDQF